MLSKISSNISWLPYYVSREVTRTIRGDRARPEHVYLCICDHFEPYWNGADRITARKRIQLWLDEYPKIADTHRDSSGQMLKYTFFFPEEEYREDDLNALAGLCHAGYGEVEIHLHHDNDTAENFRRTLVDYKKRLHEKHGLLSIDKDNGEISYGFIHGNWSLNNSRPDGRWCGVNGEIPILLETGCYADFTMPSAPNPTQTSKVNSIYYAIDNPGKPKSHNWGVDAKIGLEGEGLLMVQGPLNLNWRRRKFGLIPRIENGGLLGNNPPSRERINYWISAGVCVQGKPEHVFVKIYTHGAQEGIMQMLFNDNGFETLFDSFEQLSKSCNFKLHYLSAREMVNTLLAIMNTETASLPLKLDGDNVMRKYNINNQTV
jgi:hypothetical protein